MSYELHPETPLDGVLLSTRFRGRDLTGFYNQLNARGKEFGIVFGKAGLLPNSKLALQASEYARDQNKYDSFHENMFHAYFTCGLDIGNRDVVANVAEKSGLNEKEMFQAFGDGRYLRRLDEVRKDSEVINLTGVPTFIIENKHKIVGAQPLEVFRDLLQKIGGDKK